MILSLRQLDFSIGGPLLLEQVNLDIGPDERVALVGRNGAGKSTLLKLMTGDIQPDDGQVIRSPGVRVAHLQQDVPDAGSGTVYDVIAAGLGELGTWLVEFHHLSQSGENPDRLADIQGRIEVAEGWDLEQRVATVLAQLDLNGELLFEQLSGGLKRRVLLGRALVQRPDILLLDEPTNHLDIAAIEWLESFLKHFSGSLVFVTHDRRFLKSLATRIVEIDRGQVTSWPGDWDNYQRRVDERLHAESLEQARMDKKLAEEEVWIRQGIKARRTRNEGRVRALKRLRAERAQRRERQGQVQLQVSRAGQSGRKVIEAENITHGWSGQPLVKNFSTVIMRGDRIGLIGPNGSGKTTLIQLLLGEARPEAGEVRLGTGLEIAYYDQLRAVLRDDWSAAENVAEGRDFVEIDGKRKHIIGYLQDFLFSPERARAPISKLSGGERNRLLLARLFARPSNFLVMDEPTNDLDAETLELLEERLADYPGTLLLVSHDREFLDNVVTSTLVFEGEGRVVEYVGGYSDWLRQRPAEGAATTSQETKTSTPKLVADPATAKPAKLSYKLARELEQLPAQLESLEAEIERISALMNDPTFYQRSSEEIAEVNNQARQLQNKLDQAYQRWEELESARG